MLRAWRSIERFEGRAQLRTWLHRIATNVCLDMLSHRKAEREARVMAMDLGAPFTREAIAGFDGDLRARPSSTWIEPIADAAAIEGACSALVASVEPLVEATAARRTSPLAVPALRGLDIGALRLF